MSSGTRPFICSIIQHQPTVSFPPFLILTITPHRFVSHPAVRILGVTLAIALCVWTIKGAATIGLSRLFARYAVGLTNPAAGRRTVELTPNDPESHLANAEVLTVAGQPDESARELEQAIALRPSDYSLWLSLGLIRDQAGDPSGALAAFDESVRRAPFYAQPRWLRGNLRLRIGRYGDAFDDLNQAARSDPELIPNLIDLAWTVSKSDPKLTEQLAQVDTDKMRIAFARLLARQGKATETLAQVRLVEGLSSDIRRELVEQLLAKNAFKEAFEIWNGGQPAEATALIHDGGFETPLSFDRVGFEWRVPRALPAVALAVDSNKAHSGSKSLRLEFNGVSSTEPPFVSQLIMIETPARYRISFAARSQELVSGGLPLVVLKDAAGEKKLLGVSTPLSKGTTDWQISSFEFDVPVATQAVFVGIQRESCATSPCPAFGTIWLDSFSLERLK